LNDKRFKKSCHLVEMPEEQINLKQLASSTSPNKDAKQKESIDDCISMLSTKTTQSVREMISSNYSKLKVLPR